MNNAENFFIAILFLIILISGAGCIESHVQKSETVLTKLDQSDNIQWTKVFENVNYSSARSSAISNRIIQTSDEGYIIAGRFSDTALGDSLRLIKTNRAGETVWDTSEPVSTGDLEFLAIFERLDHGYTVIGRHGHVYLLNASGAIEGMQEISRQLNKNTLQKTEGAEYPPVTLHSVARVQDSSLILVVENYADIYKPLEIVGLSENGTVIWKKIPDPAVIAGTTNIIPTEDGGFLLGKSNAIAQLEMSKVFLMKTDFNTSPLWNLTLGSCNKPYCENVVLGMHESENHGYEIIYLSSEVNKSGSDRGNQMIVVAGVDPLGQLIKEEAIDEGALPRWIWDEAILPSELMSRMAGSHVNSTFSSNVNRNQESHTEALIKTHDEGFAIIENRYFL